MKTITKNTLVYFFGFLASGTLLIFIEVFLFNKGDTFKWGSQLGAFEVGMVFLSIVAICATFGSLIFFIMFSGFTENINSKLLRIMIFLSGMFSFLLSLFFGEDILFPTLFVPLLGEFFGIAIGWSFVGFIMTSLIFSFYYIFVLNS